MKIQFGNRHSSRTCSCSPRDGAGVQLAHPPPHVHSPGSCLRQTLQRPLSRAHTPAPGKPVEWLTKAAAKLGVSGLSCREGRRRSGGWLWTLGVASLHMCPWQLERWVGTLFPAARGAAKSPVLPPPRRGGAAWGREPAAEVGLGVPAWQRPALCPERRRGSGGPGPGMEARSALEPLPLRSPWARGRPSPRFPGCWVMADFATPWTVAHQAPPSMGFSRQEHWSGLPFPSPGDLPVPGMEPVSPAWHVGSSLLGHQGSPLVVVLI